jgi:Tfp pilus assembly protein PilX
MTAGREYLDTVLRYYRKEKIMRIGFGKNGSALLVTVFAVAVLAILTIGILQINTEELQIARNQIYAAQALATAEAGLNDAYAQLRSDPNWSAGFSDKEFEANSYTVVLAGTFPNFTVASTGVTVEGYTARMSADLTIGTQAPYTVRIDKLRINE